MRARAPKADLPVFICREERSRSGGVTWTFWCPFCRRRHIHGAVAGHRVAHCIRPDSPFKRGGYILRAKR
jgi:hypothetical protein